MKRLMQASKVTRKGIRIGSATAPKCSRKQKLFEAKINSTHVNFLAKGNQYAASIFQFHSILVIFMESVYWAHTFLVGDGILGVIFRQIFGIKLCNCFFFLQTTQ